MFFGNARPYGYGIQNLINILSYKVLFYSLYLQLGIVLALSIISLVVIYYNDKKIFSYLLFLGIFISAFFISDIFKYIGYSRWNLFLLPIVIFLTYNIFIYFRKKTSVLILIIVLILASNFLLSSVNIDGSRRVWGSVLSNDTDRTYPYVDALTYIKNSGMNHEKIYFIGENLPAYPHVMFYLNKLSINATPVFFELQKYDKQIISDADLRSLYNYLNVTDNDSIILSPNDVQEQFYSTLSDQEYTPIRNEAYTLYLRGAR